MWSRIIQFACELDLAALGFEGMLPATMGRPAYHPATLLKIYLYGYLNRIPSSRRLERETQRNIELMWLTGRREGHKGQGRMDPLLFAAAGYGFT
jgi:transposase